MKIYDNHNRRINYLRLAVTDRCNLRCFYCMPEEGINYVPKNDLMSYEEMERLVRLLVNLGIEKVRITGGEPFVRRNMFSFLQKLTAIEGLKKINITTNGTLTAPLLPELKKIGIHSVNLSLDTLNKARFYEITRRNVFDQVMQTFDGLLALGFDTKINMVVMDGRNTEDILPMVNLTKNHPVSVRFIEEMPFNGSGSNYAVLKWNYKQILNTIKKEHPKLYKLPDPPHSTAATYQIPGFKGNIGVIAAYSRTFCGTCNRIRITPTGMLRTCLYDTGIFNIRDLMRNEATEEQITTAFLDAMGNRAKDGYEAEQRRSFGLPVQESMATVGG